MNDIKNILSILSEYRELGYIIISVYLVYRFFDSMRLSKLEELYIGKKIKTYRELGTFLFFAIIFGFLNFVLGFKIIQNQNNDEFIKFSFVMLMLTLILLILTMIPNKLLEKLYDKIRRKDKDEIKIIKDTLLTCIFSTLTSIPSFYIVNNSYDKYLKTLDSPENVSIIDAILHMDLSAFFILIGVVSVFQALIIVFLLSQITMKVPDIQIIRLVKQDDGKEKAETLYVYAKVGKHIVCGEDENYRKCENRFLDFEEEIKTSKFKYVDKSTYQAVETTDYADAAVEKNTKDTIICTTEVDKPIKVEVSIVNDFSNPKSLDMDDCDT